MCSTDKKRSSQSGKEIKQLNKMQALCLLTILLQIISLIKASSLRGGAYSKGKSKFSFRFSSLFVIVSVLRSNFLASCMWSKCWSIMSHW
jgi:hypothetical protein